MKTLKISKDVELPVDIITERLAFVGQSGSGKTYAAMRLAELMLDAGAQIISLDPMAVWWGLLSAADGKASGYPVHVFGGDHAHVPIVPEAGALVADVIVSKGISAVIDIADFTVSEQVMFASAFAERFYEQQRKLKRPVHLFLEEAHNVLPQNLPAEGRGGDPRRNPAVMLNRMERIVRQGRSQGIGCSMISQQPQAVNKKALNQAGTLFAMRTMGKHERKAVADWMADKATDSAQIDLDAKLPKLDTGHAYIASPHFLDLFTLTRISKKVTFDSSATPKFGVQLEPPKVLADVDVQALREAMAAVVEKVEGDDPAPLRRRIAELERELAAARATARVEIRPIIGPDLADEISELANRCKGLAGVIADLFLKYPTDAGLAAPAPASRPPWLGRPLSEPVATGGAPKLAGTGLKKGAREMLRELAALHPRSLTRRQLATRVVMAHAGGSFGDYLSALRSAGFIEDDENGDSRATAAGLKAAGAVRPKSRTELVALWAGSGRLKRGARQMLDALLDRGAPLTRDQLAAAAGMEVSGGSFGDYLSALRSSGCVDEQGKAFVAGHALSLGEGQ